MQFCILDGLKTVSVSPEAWNDWHATLNEKQDVRTRSVDVHSLSLQGTRIRVKTLFTGGPGPPWVTFVTGYPGLVEESQSLGEARKTHHSLVQTLLDMGWRMNNDFNPKHYTGG